MAHRLGSSALAPRHLVDDGMGRRREQGQDPGWYQPDIWQGVPIKSKVAYRAPSPSAQRASSARLSAPHYRSAAPPTDTEEPRSTVWINSSPRTRNERWPMERQPSSHFAASSTPFKSSLRGLAARDEVTPRTFSCSESSVSPSRDAVACLRAELEAEREARRVCEVENARLRAELAAMSKALIRASDPAGGASIGTMEQGDEYVVRATSVEC